MLIGLIVVMMMFVFVFGEVDLLVVLIVVFLGVVVLMLIIVMYSVVFGIVVGVFVGGVVGFVNGVLIVCYWINLLIVMFVMMEVVCGFVFIMLNGDVVMILEECFFDFGGGLFFGILYLIWSNIVGFVVFGFLLCKMVFGKNVLVVGGNGEVVLFVGLLVMCIKIVVFVL